MNNRKKLILGYIIFILIGLIYLFISLFKTSSSCVFYRFTSIPCPSCGMTRAFKNLIALNINEAFRYHPLFPLVITFPYIFIKENKKLAYIIGGIFIVVWIIRLFLLFPDTSPMVQNTSAYMYKLFIYIKNLID